MKCETMDYQELQMMFDPSDKNLQMTNKALLTFEDGDTEMRCKWKEQLSEMYQLIPLKTGDHRAMQSCYCFYSKVLVLHLTHKDHIEHDNYE